MKGSLGGVVHVGGRWGKCRGGRLGKFEREDLSRALKRSMGVGQPKLRREYEGVYYRPRAVSGIIKVSNEKLVGK